MEYIFFYLSVVIVITVFLFFCRMKKPGLPGVIIGLTTIGYSLTNDIFFGDRLKLFYYINPEVSTLYMILSAILIYSLLNIIYTMFLPHRNLSAFFYTVSWILGMLLFEYASILTKTIVFTGWKPIPWSIVTYIAAYFLIYFFYKFLKTKYNSR